MSLRNNQNEWNVRETLSEKKVSYLLSEISSVTLQKRFSPTTRRKKVPEKGARVLKKSYRVTTAFDKVPVPVEKDDDVFFKSMALAVESDEVFEGRKRSDSDPLVPSWKFRVWRCGNEEGAGENQDSSSCDDDMDMDMTDSMAIFGHDGFSELITDELKRESLKRTSILSTIQVMNLENQTQPTLNKSDSFNNGSKKRRKIFGIKRASSQRLDTKSVPLSGMVDEEVILNSLLDGKSLTDLVAAVITIPFWSEPSRFFTLLVDCFVEELSHKKRTHRTNRFFDIIKWWFKFCSQDFLDEELLFKMRTFIDEYSVKKQVEDDVDIIDSLLNLITSKVSTGDVARVFAELMDPESFNEDYPSIETVKGKKKVYILGNSLFKHLTSYKKLNPLNAIDICNEFIQKGYLTPKSKKKVSRFKEQVYYQVMTTPQDITHILYNYARPLDNYAPSTKQFLSFKTSHLARQMTFIDLASFRRITIRDIVDWILTKVDKRSEKCKHVFGLTTYFNHVSWWVVTEIVNTPNLRMRKSVLKKFIMLAKELLDLNNYNGLLMIMSGLCNPSVNRLKQTWKISEKYLKLYKSLDILCSPLDNWENYRVLIERESRYLPYLGLILGDLTYLSTAAFEGDKVNWDKLVSISLTIQQITSPTESEIYESIRPDPEVQDYLLNGLYSLEDEETYELSKQIENPNRRDSVTTFNFVHKKPN
eukprot:TRINITY_DN4984_c0_g1_i1.p1 TRINITY_DN4984_c0_g1~~TRINITY_DN4984_c0_g1_i1.p1  ORF type:complete len:736 (+),score=112.72 TRINITY_DN4984_c0_g1_i1:102-2210(+)